MSDKRTDSNNMQLPTYYQATNTLVCPTCHGTVRAAHASARRAETEEPPVLVSLCAMFLALILYLGLGYAVSTPGAVAVCFGGYLTFLHHIHTAVHGILLRWPRQATSSFVVTARNDCCQYRCTQML